jgi:hypothetical protein
MKAAGPPFESQARLWLTAFVVSALLNAVVLVVAGFWWVGRIVLRPPPAVEPLETVAMIVPVAESSPESEAVPESAAAPRFARTSPDQAEQAPEKREFIGERDTRATSDAAPVAGAPEMPSQQGREPEFEDEIETTESDYQDGELESDRAASPASPPQEPAAEPMREAEAEKAAAEAPAEPVKRPVPPAEAPPARERLAEGPLPVDRMVDDREAGREAPKPPPAEREREEVRRATAAKPPAELPKPAASASRPGFRGYQKKTRLEGSIARSGRSALNVEDSALGRYHAAVSRSVEKEWQRNCVRNRDYITPGLLTMSFLLDASGKVRSVTVVEDVQVGAIPKGFTLNSIHDAEIPAMPADLKKQLDGEPLEFIYRFNF